jgi:hypothetical protein
MIREITMSGKWLRGYQMTDPTRDVRRSVLESELQPKFGNQKLVEVTHQDLRALTDTFDERWRPGDGSAFARGSTAGLPLGHRAWSESPKPGRVGAPGEHSRV